MSKIPSIAMIPSAYKSGKVYSVLPSDGSADLNFARASEATRVNQNGLIEKVGSNVPRIDYTDGGCPKLLLEPQSRNLITHSEDFSDASWLRINGGLGSVPVVTANQGLSPDGSANADRVVFDLGGGTSSSDSSILANSITLGGVNQNTRSVYIKSNTGSNYNMVLGTNSPTVDNSIVEIVVTTEWQRFDLTHTPTTTTTNFYFGLRNAFGITGLSDTADILIWGAQLEEQSYATSYIPTNGGTVTRNAETASKANISNLINSSEGVLYAEIKPLTNSNYGGIYLSDNTTSNRLFLVGTSTENEIALGGNGITTLRHVELGLNDKYSKIALVYKVNSVSLWVNGVEVGTNNTFYTGNTLTTLSLNDLDLNPVFKGKTKALKVYNQALTDLELEEMTGFKSFVQMANQLNYTVI
mgnify:CR=1 FL=1